MQLGGWDVELTVSAKLEWELNGMCSWVPNSACLTGIAAMVKCCPEATR